ncbi:Sec-independent protein translocase subunit TatA [Cryobacterium sp. TMS1-13-1]|uniref:Sec-independent protein translocase subunit TatA n=1 Tax=Cryobacterium sp. TMS1-13-1 TaxID=1259220 RepID=UPI00106D2A61|nr:Sec-independent protein translocase subunit TatA [Cryobacterium sp. TMS1-13-1]TFD24179.1 twin-arginine translocase TatA/TatE family subunit [Cryobacterium sp. TMS1-13-1]
MLGNLTGWHFLIILVVILLLFGAPKLPGLARSLGQSMKIFKSEITSDRTDESRPDDHTDGSTSAQGSPSTDSRGVSHPKA